MKRTIREAIIEVLEASNEPMVPEEIYLHIEEEKLYHFNTSHPLQKEKTLLRRDCEGLDFKSASQKKYFQLLSDGTYWLKSRKVPTKSKAKVVSTLSSLNEKIEKNYAAYLVNFKTEILSGLKALHFSEFEAFCKNLITAYGFTEATITPQTKDGGIDGFGKLTIGFTDINVAFECKRWGKNKVDYKVIRSFRGSIPESCVYGIFFTTSKFLESAKKEAE